MFFFFGVSVFSILVFGDGVVVVECVVRFVWFVGWL